MIIWTASKVLLVIVAFAALVLFGKQIQGNSLAVTGYVCSGTNKRIRVTAQIIKGASNTHERSHQHTILPFNI
jgi:hypothetical protein